MSNWPATPALTVACCLDSNYLELAGVMLRSLEANGDVPDAHLVVCSFNLTPQDEALLMQCVARPITFVAMSAGERERLSALPVRRQVTSISYARLLLPDLLSDRSGLLLYIDSDTIVNRSLRPLVETELGDYALAAVPDGPEKFVTWRNRVLGRAPDAPYFNAGVQLINLVQWRQLRLGETSLAFAEANPAIVDWADQDSLNIVIGANWTPLPHVWNWCTESGAPGSFELAHIIHFTSRLKPNDRACEHPAKALYLQHRANTPWRAKTSEISRIG